MEVDRKTYVLAIDVLMDYKNVILDGKHPVNPSIDLDDAHLVIPEVVVRRLSELEEYDGERGRNAKGLVNRLRNLIENSKIPTMRATYRLRTVAKVKKSNQLLSVLPIQKNLLQSLPFDLSQDDIGDQTIATAIEASLALTGSNANGYIDDKMISSTVFDNVVLLTNDNGLAVRAHWYGVKTNRYKCKK